MQGLPVHGPMYVVFKTSISNLLKYVSSGKLTELFRVPYSNVIMIRLTSAEISDSNIAP